MMHIALVPIIGAAATIAARLTGLMLFAPFFGSVAIPARIKATLVLALTALLYPMASPWIPALPLAQWPLVCFRELVIGAAVAIVTNLVFDGVQMAGELLSIQMGYSLVNILDPQTQVETTVMATFHQMIAMLIFLRLNVEFWLLRGLARSFEYLPPAAKNVSGPLVAAALHACAVVFSVGVEIAAPVVCATVVTDVALGFLGKASPQLPLMLLGPSIKSVLGIVILICTLKFWPDQFQQFFLRSANMTDQFLHLAS